MEYAFNRPLCRLCLCYDVLFDDIFNHDVSQKYNLTTVMLELLELKVSEEDGYPQALCSACFKIIIDFKKFKDECRQAKITYDENIRPKEVYNFNRRSQEHYNGNDETSVIRPKLEFHIDNYDMWGNLITEDSKSEVNISSVVKTEEDLDQVDHQNASLTAPSHDDVDEYCNSIERKTSVQDCHKCLMCGMEFHLLSQLDLHLKCHEINPSQQESSEIIVEHLKEEECMSPGVLSTEIEMNHEYNPDEQSTENIEPLKFFECSKEFSRKCDYTRHRTDHKSVTSLTSEQNSESRFTHPTVLEQMEVNRVTPNVNLFQDDRNRTLDLGSKSLESNGMTSVELFRASTSSKLDNSNEDCFQLIQQGESLNASEFQNGRMSTMEECHSFDQEKELEVEGVGWKLRNSDVKKGEDNVNGNSTHYIYNHCSEVFNDIHSLNTHLSLHERDVSIKGKEVPSTNLQVNTNANDNIRKLSHNCMVCQKNYKGVCELRRHMKVHSGERPYECDICHQRFKDKGTRNQHVVHIHESYRCSHCYKRFPEKDKLAEHVQKCRIKRVFHCNRCNLCFDSILSRNEHLKTHNTEDVLKCRYCDKYFIRRDCLSVHERIHTKEGSFLCSICGKSYANRNSFGIHMRVHTNDRPYKCGYCDKSFIQKGNHRKHERTHTKERPFKCSYCDKSFSEKAAVKRHELIHREVKEFGCRFCGKRFSQKGYVKQHENGHLKIKKFECSICKKSFSFQTSLHKHTKVHKK